MNERAELLALWRGLAAPDRATLLRFARFLRQEAASAEPCPEPPREPLAIPRPAEENVLLALKRLRATYPMLDATRFLDQATALASAHFMHGRPAPEVIDDLETLFRDAWLAWRDGGESG